MNEYLKHFASRLYMRVYSKFHKIEKKITFNSFGGKQYSDNPRAICEKMHELYPDYKLVWRMKSNEDKYFIIPDYVKVVTDRYENLRELATSFCYVTNGEVNDNIVKRKKQFFVQTWHGDRVPKKVLYDVSGDAKRSRKIMDEFYTDLCIAGSDIGEQVYRSAFRYKGAILKEGMPRNDKLIVQCDIEKDKIRERLNIHRDKKILLYAPTYRDFVSDKQEVSVDLELTLQKLVNKTNDEWVCLTRAHSNSKGLLLAKNNKIIDVSDYPDMADLLLIADMLITDYSSSCGDFILCNKPVVLAMYDREEYESKYRELNFSIEKSGFLVANNQSELNEIIDTYSADDYFDNCKKICEFFNVCETGESAKKVCDIINLEYKKSMNKKGA